jgi:hypothetical protein
MDDYLDLKDTQHPFGMADISNIGTPRGDPQQMLDAPLINKVDIVHPPTLQQSQQLIKSQRVSCPHEQYTLKNQDI